MQNILKGSCTFILCLFFLLNDSYAQRDRLGFLMPEGYSKISFPIQIINNLVIVQVKLNSTIPLKFILDTGVRTSILTEKTFSDLLNVQYSRIVSIPGAGGQHIVTAYVANDVSLEMNGIVGKGHALLVLEEDLLQLKNFLGENVQGILGYEVFSRFVVQIDYSKQIITFYEPEEYDYNAILKKKKWSSVPITIEDTKPYFKTKIVTQQGDTVGTKLMVDTGASHPLLLDIKSSPKLTVPEEHLRSSLGRGLGGDIEGSIGRVNSLKFGKYYFNDVITTYPDSAFYAQEFKRVQRNGTIGGGILSRFKVIFDFGNGYIYFKKSKKFKQSFDYNMSGLVVKAEGLYLNQYEVVEVRKNSSADEAGIKPGDMIIEINNTSTKDLELNELNGMLNKSSKQIRLVVIQDGQKVNKTIRLKRLI